MTPLAIASIVFACVLGGALLGMRLRGHLPEYHANQESRDVVKLAMGLVATMTALVLGLVTASSKASFDAEDAAIKHSAIEILTLDRLLARYGPETREIRDTIRRAVVSRQDAIWGQDRSPAPQMEMPGGMTVAEGIEDRIGGLAPQNDAQRSLQARALEVSGDLLQSRWLVFGVVGHSVPLPFLIVLVAWLTILFLSFGLFAPRNATVIAALCISALSVSSAVFLILEMDSPLSGLMKVSDAPLRYAISHLGQ